MSSSQVMNTAKFLVVSTKSESQKARLTSFELDLLTELLSYYNNGECFEDRVSVVGVLQRKAAAVLVRKGLAAYVKDVLYPSEQFGKVFVPMLNEGENGTTHEKLDSTYKQFVEL